MRPDAAKILASRGFVPDVHFLAMNGTATSCDIVALNGTILPTEAELDAFAAGADAALLAQDHVRMVAQLSNGLQSSKIARGILLTILDEFNLHALKINAILDAIDGASTLAQVKTAIAAINDYPARTKAQMVTAITTKINAGEADT